MRFWLITAFIAIVLTFLYVYQQQQTTSRTQTISDHSTSEVTPSLYQSVHYRIGEIDPRFKISHQQLMMVSQEAANIWQQSINKILFVYDPKATLSINLIYDQRQINSNRLQSITVIAEKLHLQEQHLKQLMAAYKQNKHLYDRLITVTIGAKDNETRQLIKQKEQQLKQDEAQLKRLEVSYRQNLQSASTQAKKFNIHRSFQKGVYNGNEINIYEFQKMDDLRFIIAHELGHALGLKHNAEPLSLMYPMIQHQHIENFRLTKADKAMLQHEGIIPQ